MKSSTRAFHGSRAIAAFVAVLMGGHVMPVVSVAADPQPGSYEAIDGNVDQNTFQGWRVFHSACHVCHGTGAMGTDLAPSLLPRMESMTPSEFAELVLVRYRLLYPGDSRAAVNPAQERRAVIEEVIAKQRGPKGRINMPGWEADQEVSAHLLDLYAYLSARADGRIGPGKPGILPTR